MIKYISTLLFLFCYGAYAQGLWVSSVEVECLNVYHCYSEKNLKTLKGNFEDKKHLDRLSQIIARNDGVRSISYTYRDKHLKFKVFNNPTVGSVKVQINGDAYDEDLILPVSEGDFLTEDLYSRTKKYLQDYFTSEGYSEVKIKSSQAYDFYNVALKFEISYSKTLKVRSIKTRTLNKFIKSKIEVHLSEFVGERFRVQKLTSSIEALRLELFEMGFYFIDISWNKKVVDNDIDLSIEVKNTKRQAFFSKGISLKLESRLKQELVTTARVYKRVLSVATIKDVTSKILKNAGFFNFSIDINNTDELKKSNLVISTITVHKKERTKLGKLLFRGNAFFTKNDLEKMFYEYAEGKAAYNIIDTEYYSEFIKLLRIKYIEKGFVSVKIENPILRTPRDTLSKVIFKIREGPRTKVSSLTLKGLNQSLVQKIIKNVFEQKEESYFNPIQFEKDLKSLKSYMYNKGFYFFKIVNDGEASMVHYSTEKTQVSIIVEVDMGNIITLGNILYIGNTKTKDKLMMKYLPLKEGDIVTREELKRFQNQLLSLGLFSNVSITPLEMRRGRSDLVVSLKERDFGTVELAPGIRTDLGPKLSTSITYNNLGGMNRVVGFKGQINKRFDDSSLDEERRDGKKLLEYEAELSYSENKVFYTDWNYSASFTRARRRLFSFDADVQKLSQTFSNQFTEWFRFFISYQLEEISQFNSSIERESGKFKIGSLTPTFIFDFRDSRIRPTKGTYFNLSFERAAPWLNSQDNEELKVDYYKVVARNFFYFPFKRGTFAVSLAAGMQENLAKNRSDSDGKSTGYIPGVKVFRLNGMDLVRGYDDEEINRLLSGSDISEKEVDNKAYMVNVKLEPRFFVSDNFIAGVFYDAGRVFVDKFEGNKLRSSYGVTFKYLTPVGTLDFDYGIKTLRKKDSSGKLESPGRLHVSIGFF